MGDRVNVVIRTEEDAKAAVVLYSHWDGCDVIGKVQKAIARRLRWNDPPYLARMIACEVWRGQESSETGYGLSVKSCDNSHAAVYVDIPAKRVAIRAWRGDGVGEGAEDLMAELRAWKFDEFAKLTDLAAIEAFNEAEEKQDA